MTTKNEAKLVLLLLGTCLVVVLQANFALANPDLAPAPYPETPVKIPPTIYIQSPKNATITDDKLNL